MRIEGTRFGDIDLGEDSKIIELDRGLLGFPWEQRFVLLAPAPGKRVAWLQSIDTPVLAFPVIEGDAVGYSPAMVRGMARAAGLNGDDLAVLVIAAVSGKELVANELAPIVVDMKTLRGAQVMLNGQKFSAARPVSLIPAWTPPPQARAAASAML